MIPIYRYHKRIFITLSRSVTDWINTHVNNTPYRIAEYREIFFGINPKWWEYDDWCYDGMTQQSVTLCGIVVGKSYSYDSRPLDKFPINELQPALFWRSCDVEK